MTMLNLAKLVFYLLVAAGIFVALTGCATRGVPYRPAALLVDHAHDRYDPPADLPKADAWYIQGQTAPGRGGQEYSCSFVEFDERGDFLDFDQHTIAWKKILQFSAESRPVLLVIYCHGWKNNSQSGDVLSFNRFLSRLAGSEPYAGKYRVHGVYIGWRGNDFSPYVDTGPKSDYTRLAQEFGQPIVDTRFSRSLEYAPAWLPEQLSIWSRKNAAEFDASGVPMARAILEYANEVKALARGKGQENKVFVIGHSFGALMLEKSLGQASVAALTAQMPWWQLSQPVTAANTRSAGDNSSQDRPLMPRGLPFDCLIFVNSAAPSIYAKELSDLLWANQKSLEGYYKDRGITPVPESDVPLVVSITSENDWATHYLFPVQAMFTPFMPSLQRDYTKGVLESSKADHSHEPVPQRYFYTHTPGHNPLLVNRWIAASDAADAGPPPPDDRNDVMQWNLTQPLARATLTSSRCGLNHRAA